MDCLDIERKEMFKKYKLPIIILLLIIATSYSGERKEVWDYDNWVTTFNPRRPNVVPYDRLLRIRFYEAYRTNPRNQSWIAALDGYRHKIHTNTDSIRILSNDSIIYSITYDKGKPTTFSKGDSTDVTNWEYDSQGRLTLLRSKWKSVTPEIVTRGRETSLKYNRKGMIISSITKSYPDTSKSQIVDFSYNTQERLKEVTDWLGSPPDSLKRVEHWEFQYEKDTVRSVAAAFLDSLSDPEVYLRNENIIENGMLKRRVRVSVRNGVPSLSDSTEYIYKGDTLIIEEEFRIFYSKAPTHEHTVRTYYNESGQPQRRETSLHQSDKKRVRSFSYTAAGHLESSILTESKSGNPPIAKDSTVYFYNEKGSPIKIQYFVRRRNVLTLHREFIIEVNPSK